MLNKHGAGKEHLEGLYTILTASVAGRWVRGGYFVPVATLMFEATLDYALTVFNSFEDGRELNPAAIRLVRYFENNEFGTRLVPPAQGPPTGMTDQ